MPFRDRKFVLQHVQGAGGEVSKLLTKAVLLAIETIVTENGGAFEIVERRETETIFRVSPGITVLMIRRQLSKMSLKPEIKLVV